MASSPAGYLVIDANVLIAIALKEAGRVTLASAEIAAYAAKSYIAFVPGVLVSEFLYVVCQKFQAGSLSALDHAIGIQAFQVITGSFSSLSGGDLPLVGRANQISAGYGCSRSADAIYIALAEELAKTGPTTLLTFDRGVQTQAKIHAPGVTVHLL